MCVMAATTVFSTSPMTKAETVEVVQEISQNNAENMIMIHAKGTGLNVYAWGGSAPEVKYPGAAMQEDTKMGDGWLYYEVPADCIGFIINKGEGDENKLTGDVQGMSAGEYWFVNGEFSTTNPEGSVTPTDTPITDPTATPDVTPSAKPESAGEITIKSITPEDNSELEAGKEQTIKVDAESSIGDGTLYYKFEVSCDGNYVGDRYYSKNTEYKFTPEAGKTYKAIIYVQAHDEENTVKKEEYTYTASGDDNSTNDPGKTSDPGAPTSSPNAGAKTPTPKPDTTGTPKATATVSPGEGTAKPTSSPSVTNGTSTQSPTGTSAPDSTAIPLDNVSNIDVKFSVSKTSAVALGSSVELTAIASNGTGTYTYRFRAKKSTETQAKVIRDFSESSTCIWTPSAKGTYTLYVDVKDSSGSTAVTKTITSYKVKTLTLSVSTSKKSPQKKKTKIKITAKSSYASGSVKYKFVIKLKGKKVKATSYKKSKTYTWKPTKKGTYTIYVYAKDSKNTVVKKKNFKIK